MGVDFSNAQLVIMYLTKRSTVSPEKRASNFFNIHQTRKVFFAFEFWWQFWIIYLYSLSLFIIILSRKGEPSYQFEKIKCIRSWKSDQRRGSVLTGALPQHQHGQSFSCRSEPSYEESRFGPYKWDNFFENLFDGFIQTHKRFRGNQWERHLQVPYECRFSGGSVKWGSSESELL